jgi:alkylhydroperoxidase/carboxymuconolactone decarboxylase family protein YurZ
MVTEEFEVLLSGMPEIKSRFSELMNLVLWNGPLEPRCRAIAMVAVAIAASHPQLSEVLAWAKQAGMRNEEISHVAAIAAVVRAGGLGSSPFAGNGQSQPAVATCC